MGSRQRRLIKFDGPPNQKLPLFKRQTREFLQNLCETHVDSLPSERLTFKMLIIRGIGVRVSQTSPQIG
ncbi:MAG: hypothetical protein AUJ04_06065 [Acidobacteria bacterium 13_1_40CM_3_55_6]|nr:MAG: hypothetical protein AUJ04_06065 [Acidobacteria bacterium 13_1_40CM_3_55_6]